MLGSLETAQGKEEQGEMILQPLASPAPAALEGHEAQQNLRLA